MNNSNYWNFRAKMGYEYKGEMFYTVTAIPYYYKRREIILSILRKILKEPAIKNVLDFGCGDGVYIKKLDNHTKKFTGIDISKEMINIAQKNSPHCDFFQNISHTHKKFDFIYVIAVFAHISDDSELQHIFNDFFLKLSKGGKVFIFEQVSPSEKKGENYIRRTHKKYCELATNSGFKITQQSVIAFPFHRNIFEKLIAPAYIRFFAKKNTPYESCIEANKHYFYRALSKFMLIFTRNPIKNNKSSLEGNIILILEK